MPIRLTWLCLTALLLPFSNVGAHPLPEPYEVVYTATYNGMDVEARHELEKNNQGFQLSSKIKGLLGGMTEVEEFHTDDKGHIHPDAYRAEKSFFGIDKTETMIVDHAVNKALYTRKEKRRELKMKPGYLGPVSYQLQLRHDVSALSLLPAKIVGPDSSFSYQVLSRGKIKEYVFKIIGKELLDTPLGPLPTWKLERVRDGGKRKTIFWMAPDWEFMVVKIRQSEKGGEQYEMLVKTASIKGQAMTLPVQKGDSVTGIQ